MNLFILISSLKSSLFKIFLNLFDTHSKVVSIFKFLPEVILSKS